MGIQEFAERHYQALSSDEVRHNVLLAVIKRGLSNPELKVKTWSLGKPGCCAVQQDGYGIVLGNVATVDAEELAGMVAGEGIPSVMGPDETAHRFVEAARLLGDEYPHVLAQTIHVLDHPPATSPTPGEARLATPADTELVFAWLTAFRDEAVPHDDPPTLKEAQKRIEAKRVYFWIRDNAPVAMSCVGRVLETGVAIAPVYTPPENRSRGFAGAATAAIVAEVLKRGYRCAYLFTDDGNPASNRCYAKIGFRPYCKANMYLRKQVVPEARKQVVPEARKQVVPEARKQVVRNGWGSRADGAQLTSPTCS